MTSCIASLTGAAVFAFFALAGDAAEARRWPGAFPSDINVRAFGAAGDGVHDDTAAVQAAFKAAEKAWRAWRPAKGGQRFYAAHLYCEDAAAPAVVFPEGRYLVDGTVFVNRYAIMRGLGDARIVQKNPGATTFFLYRVFLARVENLKFFGGRTQLDLSTLNVEAANFLLRDCVFARSTGPAVKSISMKMRDPGQRVGWRANVGEYMLDEKTGEFVPDPRYADQSALLRQNNSTMFVVEDCTFDRCARAMDYACDGSVLRNCRILTPKGMKGGAVRVTNRMHVFGMKAVVDRDKSLRQSVFEVTSSFNAHDSSPLVFIEDSSFRTLDGSGVCLVESSTVPRYRSSTIALRNLDVECAGSPENAIVHCAKGTFPNLVAVVNCRERGRGGVRALAADTAPTDDFLKKIKHYSHISVERQFRFCFHGNSKNIDVSGPAWATAHADRYFAGPDSSPPVKYSRIRRTAARTFLAEEHGVRAGPSEDATEALRALVALAAKEPGSRIVLPSGTIRLTDTVELSGDVEIAGSGASVVDGVPLDRDIFRVIGGARVLLRKTAFIGGRRVVSFDDPGGSADIALEDCRAFGMSDAALHVAGRPGASKLRIVNGVYYAPTLYRGNADAAVDGAWFRLLPPVEDSEPMPEVRGMVNLAGGRLVCRDCLGVPYIVHHRTPVDSEQDPALDKEEYRWVDNYGEFYSQCTRYGGERGGVCPVFSHGRGPVCIEGEHANFWANNMQRSPIVNDRPDADCRIFDVVFPAETMWLPRIEPAWRRGPRQPLMYYENAEPVCVFPVPEARLANGKDSAK